MKGILHKFSGNISRGFLFSIGSFLSTYTILIPMLTVMYLGAFLESFASLFVSKKPYSNVAELVISILTCLAIVVFVVSAFIQRKRYIEKRPFSNFWTFILFFIIIHTLGFYVYWGIKLNYRMDGQLMFLIFESFPYSSLGFIPIGILLEISKIVPFEKIMITRSWINSPEKKKIDKEDSKNKIISLMVSYEEKSTVQLQEIITDMGWSSEAKEAAKTIIDRRSNEQNNN